MVIVGLLLLVVGAVFGIDIAMKNRFSVGDVEAFGSTLGLHHADEIFVLGAVTGAVVLLGLALVIAGAGRSRAKSAARRRQRRAVAETNQRAADLEAENQRLRSSAEPAPTPTEGRAESVVRTDRGKRTDRGDRAESGGRSDEVAAGDAEASRVVAGSGGSTALQREG